MAFIFSLLINFFPAGGRREEKVNYNKDLSCFLRHTALVTFAICRPMYKGIQDSLGFWIPRRGFRIPGTGFQSLSVELGFWIPIVSGIPDSLSSFPDSGFHKQKFIGFPHLGRYMQPTVVIK